MMSNKCKYCDFVGTNDAMVEHAGEMCWERLNQGQENLEKADSPLPDWFPGDPYPLSMCSIKTDDDYEKAIPDPALRSAISWYLMGETYRMTSKRILKALREHLDLGT